MWGAEQRVAHYLEAFYPINSSIGLSLGTGWMFYFRKQELALNFENWKFHKGKEFLEIFDEEIG